MYLNPPRWALGLPHLKKPPSSLSEHRPYLAGIVRLGAFSPLPQPEHAHLPGLFPELSGLLPQGLPHLLGFDASSFQKRCERRRNTSPAREPAPNLSCTSVRGNLRLDASAIRQHKFRSPCLRQFALALGSGLKPK